MGSHWQQIGGWLLQIAVIGTVVLGAVALGLRGMRLPQHRHRLAASGMMAVVLAIPLSLLPSWWNVEAPQWSSVSAAPEVSEAFEVRAEPERWIRADSPETVPTFVEIAPLPDRNVRFVPLLILLYATCVSLALLRLLVGYVGLMRLHRRREPLPCEWAVVANAMIAERHIAVGLSATIHSPVCFGLFRQTILLPKSTIERTTANELRWILAHELDHLRRGDPWTGLWVGLARAVYFPVPWFWSVRRELNLSQEFLADAAAARVAGEAVGYAAFLVRLSTPPETPSSIRCVPNAVGVRASPSDLLRRVTMLVDSKPLPEGRLARLWSALASACLIAIAIALSGVGIGADDKPKAKPDALQNDAAKTGKYYLVTDSAGKGEQVTAFPATGSETVLDVVPKAEGTAKRTIWIARTLAGQPEQILPVDWKAITQLGRTRTNYQILPGDRVYVKQVEKPAEVKKDAAKANQSYGRLVIDYDVDFDTKALQKSIETLRAAIEEVKDQPEARAALEKAIAALHKRIDAAAKNSMPPELFSIVRRDVHASPESGRLGIEIEVLGAALIAQLDLPKGQGILVTAVLKDSLANKVGLKPNDVIVELGGKPVSNDAETLPKIIAAMKADVPFDIVVVRKGKKETIQGVKFPAAKGKANSSSSMSVSVTNDDFTIDSTKDNVKIHIAGKVVEGKAIPSQITVVNGEFKHDVNTFDDVPAAHKDAVRLLLKTVEKAK